MQEHGYQPKCSRPLTDEQRRQTPRGGSFVVPAAEVEAYRRGYRDGYTKALEDTKYALLNAQLLRPMVIYPGPEYET